MPQSPSRRQICRGLAFAACGLVMRPLSTEAATVAEPADLVVVLKSQRKLLLMRHARVIAHYPVALGTQPHGPKRQQGDKRTPEGSYRIDAFNPHSRFHRALHISYPNAEDLREASAAGVVPGGDIEIHGLPRGFERYDPAAFAKDWTDGCVAVSNRAMDEIWARVQIDTPVAIIA